MLLQSIKHPDKTPFELTPDEYQLAVEKGFIGIIWRVISNDSVNIKQSKTKQPVFIQEIIAKGKIEKNPTKK